MREFEALMHTEGYRVVEQLRHPWVEEGRAEGRVEGIAQGKVETLHKTLLMGGTARFGEPDAATRESIVSVTDPAILEGRFERLFRVASWAEMVAPE